jgi:hypothetical protein
MIPLILKAPPRRPRSSWPLRRRAVPLPIHRIKYGREALELWEPGELGDDGGGLGIEFRARIFFFMFCCEGGWGLFDRGRENTAWIEDVAI